jgi:hypothetical protein
MPAGKLDFACSKLCTIADWSRAQVGQEVSDWSQVYIAVRVCIAISLYTQVN